MNTKQQFYLKIFLILEKMVSKPGWSYRSKEIQEYIRLISMTSMNLQSVTMPFLSFQCSSRCTDPGLQHIVATDFRSYFPFSSFSARPVFHSHWGSLARRSSDICSLQNLMLSGLFGAHLQMLKEIYSGPLLSIKLLLLYTAIQESNVSSVWEVKVWS